MVRIEQMKREEKPKKRQKKKRKNNGKMIPQLKQYRLELKRMLFDDDDDDGIHSHLYVSYTQCYLVYFI